MSDDRILPRLSSDNERRRLKAATETAVKMSGGLAFEPHTRVRKAVLSKYGGVSEPDHFIPLDVILELDRHNGAPLITSALAAMLGFRLTPEAQSDEEEIGLADAQAIAKETGDVVNLLLSILTSKPRMDAADWRDVLREVTEAKAALFKLATKIGGGQG